MRNDYCCTVHEFGEAQCASNWNLPNRVRSGCVPVFTDGEMDTHDHLWDINKREVIQLCIFPNFQNETKSLKKEYKIISIQ